ncbi:hypothetical protein KAR91_11225 [Candidatus Pacearchaeota archaeon]|nr:hypothetical protein [Candidatus Pacearchaeota archaeon]
MKILHIIALCGVLLQGCSAVTGTASINRVGNTVTFSSTRPTAMAWEEDGVKVSYDSQSESFMSKLLSIVGLGALGARN